jgi:predicted RNase H-like nuclease
MPRAGLLARQTSEAVRLPRHGRSTAAGHGLHGATNPAAARVARYGQFMRTVGVDLSAEAPGTGIAVIDWDTRGGRLNEVRVGADDAVVLAALDNADRAAVDCPLGWPEPFVDFLIAHRAGRASAPTGQSGLEWRRELSRRATDLHVAETVSGCVPLAVSADRIAAVAMRAAGLLAALADAGRPVDRSGVGLLVEVYPAAALRIWGLASRSYKGTSNQAALGLLVEGLRTALPDLDWSGHDTVCRQSDDALDAVVCALIARAVHLGLTAGPPDHLSIRAATEGWIHLPSSRDSLAKLAK